MDWICGVPGRCFYTVGLYAAAGAGRIPAGRDTKQHPGTTRAITKTGDAIWGPIENFWPRVARGSVVEVWAYRVEGGTVELYFVDGSQEVRGTDFATEVALFESEP